MVTFYSYIVNFLSALNLGLTKPQLNHILTFMHGIILTDGRKTVHNEIWKEIGIVDQGFIDYLNDETKVTFPWSMIDKLKEPISSLTKSAFY